MSLPNPSMAFFPFDPLPASQLNDLVENIEALADGSGLDALAVSPDKRGGGFKVGTILAATLATTGNKAITGVGFSPKEVQFVVMATTDTNTIRNYIGFMDEAGTQFAVGGASSSSDVQQHASSSRCILWGNANSSTFQLGCSYISIDADGFTINVNENNGTFDIKYIARA